MKRRTLNRLNDYFFKRLMGDDKRSDLTLRFLNLILNRTEENAFKKVEFLNPEYISKEKMLFEKKQLNSIELNEKLKLKKN